MKIKYLIVSVLLVLALNGCAVSDNIKDTESHGITETEQTKNQADQSSNEATDENKEALKNEPYLKVSDFKDYAPFYSVSFRKIEGETNLLFSGSTENGDSKTIVPDNVRIEPEDAIWELSYWFDGNADLADTVTLQFWNRGNAGSVMVEIDGLQYKLALPSAESELVTMDKKVEKLGLTIKNVNIYTNALVFEIEGAEDNNCLFLLADSKDNKTAPTRTAYVPEEKKLQLLYVFEDPIKKEDWTMKIKDISEASDAQSEYIDCRLELIR